MRADPTGAFAIRPIRREDAPALALIDAAHTGVSKPEWWDDVVERHVRKGAKGGARVGLVAVAGKPEKVVGYVLGQVRAFEFGSDPCGWIYAVGVSPARLREGIATRLLEEARKRFAEIGMKLIRTMVRRDDVPVLTVFRNEGFAAGPYVELELALTEVGR